MDVWQYIFRENIEIPSLYFTHRRKCFLPRWRLARLGTIHEVKTNRRARGDDFRCRTIGDITCTGLTCSKADNLVDIIREIAATRVTERGGRFDDKRSEAAMEDRKKEGYF
jgi:sulfate adenylyltransferase subunit 2